MSDQKQDRNYYDDDNDRNTATQKQNTIIQYTGSNSINLRSSGGLRSTRRRRMGQDVLCTNSDDRKSIAGQGNKRRDHHLWGNKKIQINILFHYSRSLLIFFGPSITQQYYFCMLLNRCRWSAQHQQPKIPKTNTHASDDLWTDSESEHSLKWRWNWFFSLLAFILLEFEVFSSLKNSAQTNSLSVKMSVIVNFKGYVNLAEEYR